MEERLTLSEIQEVNYETHRLLDSGDLEYHPYISAERQCDAQIEKSHRMRREQLEAATTDLRTRG